MGVLDIPSHRILIREIAENIVTHVEEDPNESHEEDVNVNQKPRRQRTPKLGRKLYGSHDIKKGKGVRQKRRSENLFFLYSLVDSLDIDNLEDDDYVDNHMTAFGELFIDPNKMQVWSQFMSLNEEQQQNYLEDVQRCKPDVKPSDGKAQDGLVDTSNVNPNFEKIGKKIKDYLRSDSLVKESLLDFEEDFVSTMTDFPFAVLLLNMPSSYERLLIHGLCQYMHLKATTHKFKRKCLMEIESVDNLFEVPSQLLSDYLQTLQENFQ